MPKVFLNENQRLNERFASWLYGEMKCQGISQMAMAEELEISQPALSKKIRNRSFTFSDFLTIVRVLQPDAKELDRLLGR